MSRNARNNENGKFDRISSQHWFRRMWQMLRNFVKLLNLCKIVKHRKAYHVGESDKSGDQGECDKNMAIVANMVKFCQIAKLMQIS